MTITSEGSSVMIEAVRTQSSLMSATSPNVAPAPEEVQEVIIPCDATNFITVLNYQGSMQN